ncbi:MAG: 2-hydroxyacyl-CoA dehydratase [Desulfatitalea sp.]|nr:2-hydroxyacyl-CoA dehydratase family protein [Desulfatitalea sp.]NNJ99665.1 2-hydroxyacyl-CoA dehydratase [Desulfatitalea sp.]
MNELMDKFNWVVKDTNAYLTRWKKQTGKKIMGCYPMYVPEEIIHAAGLLPVTIFAKDEPVTLADQHMHRYVCHVVRGNFDLSLKNRLDYLDGVVFTDFCLTVRMASSVWMVNNPQLFYHQIFTPQNMVGDQTPQSLTRQFVRLKKALEDYTGQEITQDALSKSIAIYQENRELLCQLYKLRQANPERFRARDIAMVVAAGMVMPKEEHSTLLAQLIEQAGALAPQQAEDKVRVIISGAFCDFPQPGLLNMIEDTGALVCDDDIFVGRRLFNTPTARDKEPIQALVERYLNDLPDPNKHNPDNEWVPYLVNLVKETKAQGIVMLVVKYCEAHQFDLPYLSKELTAAGIPILIIETNDSGATEQMRTRLQAFTEMLISRRD